MNKKCQVFTPPGYVDKLLDSVGYRMDLMGKKILENSCGDGNILVAIVRRYIDDCVEKGIDKEQISLGLSKDVIGVEIDLEQLEQCRENLNKVAYENDVPPVSWQLYVEDYLRWEDASKYDYIVGNPPYITYPEMRKSEQDYLKKNFTTCKKGKFDYCYAFLEKSIDSLSDVGKMSYLIPSSVFKTVSGKAIREKMKPFVSSIEEFANVKVFSTALVKSSIVVMEKANCKNEIMYKDESMVTARVIDRACLGDKWSFAEIENGNLRFGDYYNVSHAVATLLNEAYVLRDGEYTESGDYYICGEYSIEKSVVRQADTPRTKSYNKNEKIIFPYRYENDIVIHYEKEEFEKRFPRATEYLKHYSDKLKERNADKNAQWFEYGRSQALTKLNQEKLLMSTVVSKVPDAFIVDEKTIPYSGLLVTVKEKKQKMGLDTAKQVLESNRFWRYAMSVGIHINGKSIRITSRDIENYRFELGEKSE